MILSSEDALILMENRDILPEQVFVNVTGTVTAQSEVLTLNNDFFFLIEVDESIVILVKDNLKIWFQGIMPTKSFIFRNIHLTTLVKGLENPCCVYAAKKDSTFCENSIDMTLVPLKYWLKDYFPNKEFCLDLRNCNNQTSNTSLIHYQGTISSIEESCYGIYVVDEKMKLFLLYWNSNITCNLKLGSKITVYNAHLIKDEKSTYLVCCLKSCLKIHNLDIDTALTFSKMNPLSSIMHLFSFRERYKIMLFRKKLHHNGLKDKRIDKILSKLVSSDLSDFPNTKQGLFDIFVKKHESLCPLLNPMRDIHQLPYVLNVTDIQNRFSDKGKKSEKNESKFCKGVTKIQKCDEDEVLIGIIFESRLGMAEFFDGNDSLPIFSYCNDNIDFGICSDLKQDEQLEVPSSSHQCSSSCFKQPTFGEKITCPILDPFYIGKLICIKKFIILTDQGDEPLNYYNKKSQLILGFNLTDSFLLETPTNSHIAECTLPLNSPNNVLSEWLCESNEFVIATVYITKVYPLTFTRNQRNSKLEGLLLKSYEAQKKPETSAEKVNAQSYKPISLNLSPEKHDFISSGQLYKFMLPKTEKENETLFQPIIQTRELKYALLKQSNRINVSVPSSVIITRLNPKSWIFEEEILLNNTLSSVVEIQSAHFPHSLVSFQALIVSKQYCSSKFQSSLASFQNSSEICNLRIEVIDKDYHLDKKKFYNEPLSVYIEREKMYFLNLFTGAVVEFTHLQRNTSKKSSNVYCSFIDISTVKIISIKNPDDLASISSIMSQIELNDLHFSHEVPKELLINIWHLNPQDNSGTQAWQVQCHICTLFKISIKSKCRTCRGILKDGKCQSRGCKNNMESDVYCSACVLVDDGSSQASVTINDTKNIQKLLTLTASQWDDILRQAFLVGEIFISGNSQSHFNSTIEHFLHQLVNSSIVLRSCLMVVKLAPRSPNAASVDMMSSHQFQEKETRIGKYSLKTLNPPLLKLTCLRIRDLF